MNFALLKKILVGSFIAAAIIFGGDFIGGVLINPAIIQPSTNKNTHGSDKPKDIAKNPENKLEVDISVKYNDLTKKENKTIIEANIKKGKAIFKKCRACHSYSRDGKNKIGPRLWNVFNRGIGSVPNYRYSAAIREFQGNWNSKNLKVFLANPKELIQGTKMRFSGLKNPSDVTDIIEYLKTLKTESILNE